MTNDAPSLDALLSFLSESVNVRAMAEATDAGRPAAEAVADGLLERFGPVVRDDTQKRRIGKLIRRVMEEEGFQWDHAGARTPGSSVFTSASVYRRG